MASCFTQRVRERECTCPPDQVVGQSPTYDCFTFEMEPGLEAGFAWRLPGNAEGAFKKTGIRRCPRIPDYRGGDPDSGEEIPILGRRSRFWGGEKRNQKLCCMPREMTVGEAPIQLTVPADAVLWLKP